MAFVAVSKQPAAVSAGGNGEAYQFELPFATATDFPTGCINTILRSHGASYADLQPPPENTAWARVEFDLMPFPITLVTKSNLASTHMLLAGRVSPAVQVELDALMDKLLNKQKKPPRTVQPQDMPLWMRYPALIPELLASDERFSHVAGVKLPVRLSEKNHSLSIMVMLLSPRVVRGVTCVSRPDLVFDIRGSFAALEGKRAKVA